MNRNDRINEALIRNIFYSAFGVFLEKEAQNIIDGVSEMALCGGLSKHVENEAMNPALCGRNNRCHLRIKWKT